MLTVFRGSPSIGLKTAKALASHGRQFHVAEGYSSYSLQDIQGEFFRVGRKPTEEQKTRIIPLLDELIRRDAENKIFLLVQAQIVAHNVEQHERCVELFQSAVKMFPDAEVQLPSVVPDSAFMLRRGPGLLKDIALQASPRFGLSGAKADPASELNGFRCLWLVARMMVEMEREASATYRGYEIAAPHGAAEFVDAAREIYDMLISKLPPIASLPKTFENFWIPTLRHVRYHMHSDFGEAKINRKWISTTLLSSSGSML